MINVLFVNDNLRLPAGITMVMKNIIDNCNSSDIHFSVLTFQSNKNNALEYFCNKGVDIYYFPGQTITTSNCILEYLVGKAKSVSFFFTIRRFFKHFFGNNTFDIVHSHFAQLDNLMFPIAKKNGVKCCISHSHSSQLSNSIIKAVRNSMLCIGLIHRADYCAACSVSAGIALFGKKFCESRKKIIVKNGIQLEKYLYKESVRAIIREKYKIQDDICLIGNVGRLNKVKNQGFLLEILAELHKTSNKYKVMIVGNGECYYELKHKSEVLGLADSVIFTGSQDEVGHYLNAFDVFVMPSLHEGLGLAAIEAQANGLECVVSSTIPKEVDLTGVVFLDIKENPSMWAEHIKLMTKMHHVEFSKIVQEKGYDIRDVCNELYTFYQNVSI